MRTTERTSGSTPQQATTLAPARTTPLRPPAFAREWPHVHIERLELERATPPAALAAVRASIFLGALLPVDVVVELTLEPSIDPNIDPNIAPRSEPNARVQAAERMWCEHSYDNGCFMFEAHVPDAVAAQAGRIVAQVHPASVAPVGETDAVVPPAELRLSPATGTRA